VNKEGVTGQKFRVYCSSEAHSSVEKAVKIAGIGSRNLVKIEVDDNFALIPSKLELALKNDKEKGYQPLCIVAAFGTTGSTAIDPLNEIVPLAKKYGTWLHVDAAFGGSALILPEFRKMAEGIEMADSIVFNPHKWLFTNFDCSAYFVKEKDPLINTFQILPEYLKTKTDGLVNDYCDWGIPLGRRFRALKLWFVIRSFGFEGLQHKIREHISFAHLFADLIKNSGKFELIAPLNFNLVCFQFVPDKNLETDKLNELNEKLLHKINATGKIYITHTKLKGKYTLRLHTSQTYIEKHHVEDAFHLIEKTASEMF
jgi:aromatic-L-amino-acid/L-tryptophan decarboxylase